MESKNLVIRNYDKPAREIVEGFKAVSAATAHEAMGRKGYIDSTIRALYPGMKICGVAVTCECRELDNLTLHAALRVAGEGDVIVCTMGNFPEQGPFGDCMATCAQSKGIAGLVINTGVRDGETIREIGFPIFCKGHCMNGTVKEQIGTVNHPIAFGGQVVEPGDVIIGDDDGLVIIPKGIAAEVLKASLQRIEDEIHTREQFLSGIDSWELCNFTEKLKNKGINLDI